MSKSKNKWSTYILWGVIAALAAIIIIPSLFSIYNPTNTTATPTTYSGLVLYPNGETCKTGEISIYRLNAYGLTADQVAATPLSGYTLWNVFSWDTAGVAPTENTATTDYIYCAVANDTGALLQPINFVPVLGQNNITLYFKPTTASLFGYSNKGVSTVLNTTEAVWTYHLNFVDVNDTVNSSMGYQPFMDYQLATPQQDTIMIDIAFNTTVVANDVAISNVNGVATEQFVSSTIIAFCVTAVWTGSNSFTLTFGSRVTLGTIGVVSVHAYFGNVNTKALIN